MAKFITKFFLVSIYPGVLFTILTISTLCSILAEDPAVCSNIARLAPKALKSLVWKIGPYYKYKTVEGKTYVDYGDGEWLLIQR